MGIENKKETFPSEKERLLAEYREARKFFRKPFGELYTEFKDGRNYDPERIIEGFFEWMDKQIYHLDDLRRELGRDEARRIDEEFKE